MIPTMMRFLRKRKRQKEDSKDNKKEIQSNEEKWITWRRDTNNIELLKFT